MTAARWVLGGLGVALASYGGVLAVTRQGPSQLVELGAWLVAGVVVHDVLVAGAVVVATAVGHRVLPASWRAPAAVALVVWGSVSLMAVPVLGRFGARPDNPTLLDRPYLAAWALGTALTILAVVVAGLLAGRRAGHRPAGEGENG